MSGYRKIQPIELSMLSADKALIHRLVRDHRFFLIGGSLTRERLHTLRCEFEHVLKLEEDDGIQPVPGVYGGPFDENTFSKLFAKATDRDKLIFNVGHHADPGQLGMEKTWK
jgi:hypothetical protein